MPYLSIFLIRDIQSGGFSAHTSSGDLGELSGPAYLRFQTLSQHIHFHPSVFLRYFINIIVIFYLSIASLGFLVSGIILAWSCAGLAGDHSLSFSLAFSFSLELSFSFSLSCLYCRWASPHECLLRNLATIIYS